MSTSASVTKALHHHIRRMSGRDPQETHRVASSLELLFDLTFATCFAFAATQLAHALAAGHYSTALIGFAFAAFCICWAWTNFSWFASAYDTDDWIFRIATMVQMSGVLVLAIGLPRLFSSIEQGEHLDASVMVLGYVIMRVAMIFQWLRAAKQDPSRRRACITYAVSIAVAQLGWIALFIFPMSISITITLFFLWFLVEFAGPILAERRDGGTPWHAEHISERYSLFAIIALGEGLVGTVATLSAEMEHAGWTLETALACVAGVGITFGMWWVYSILPSAHVLHTYRSRAFVWSYGQILIIASIVATGAGLDVAANFIENKAHIGVLPALLASAIPLAIFLGLIYALHYFLVRRFDLLHVWLLIATGIVIATSIIAAILGASIVVCLVILMLAPIITVVGYEVLGHRHQGEMLNSH
ncbi:low temperature requirement protein A [Pseudomonas paracarnis]|uniref:Low temperature requirement protein A n=1 Tax=Pseudomonas paracarnis TaxID=2750625 RepID=A0ABU6BZF4_9PSED|nr:low temperature requirement protein A [Pseudomonas paracarnis]MBW9244497.1 low temperature requirement protein A [Pseudomonas paracarnis]MEB3785703.1 low temperature requirement protein A [Pseudomonas paracarnis]